MYQDEYSIQFVINQVVGRIISIIIIFIIPLVFYMVHETERGMDQAPDSSIIKYRIIQHSY